MPPPPAMGPIQLMGVVACYVVRYMIQCQEALAIFAVLVA